MNAKHAIRMMRLQVIILRSVGDVIILMVGPQPHSATRVSPTAPIAIPGMHLRVTMAASVPTATKPIRGLIIHLVTLAWQIVNLATDLPLGTMTDNAHHATIPQTGVMPNLFIPMMMLAPAAMKKVGTIPGSVATAIPAPQHGPK